jgi:hypothetical protein
MRRLTAQVENGEITKAELRNQVEVFHALKVECDARLIEDDEEVAVPEDAFEQASLFADMIPESVKKRISVEAGRLARDKAMAQVEQAAPPDWKHEAFAAIKAVAREHEQFTTDDVWRHVGWQPPEPRAMGPLMTHAARLGFIEKIAGAMREGDRVVNHARPQQVWRSLIYGQTPPTPS